MSKTREFVARDEVVAIFGGLTSSRTMAIGLVTNSSGLAVVSLTSTANSIFVGRENIFPTSFKDEQQGDALALYMRETLHKKKAALLYASTDAYSSSLAQTFAGAFERLGGKLAITRTFTQGETNFTPTLQDIKAASPDFIFAPVYATEIALIARQAKSLGIASSMLVGGDGWGNEVLLHGSTADLEGAVFANHYATDAPGERNARFVAAFRAAYGALPSVVNAAAYDGANVLANAIHQTRTPSRASVKVALNETKNYDGVTGTISFVNHVLRKPVFIVKIVGGNFRYVTAIP